MEGEKGGRGEVKGGSDKMREWETERRARNGWANVGN